MLVQPEGVNVMIDLQVSGPNWTHRSVDELAKALQKEVERQVDYWFKTANVMSGDEVLNISQNGACVEVETKSQGYEDFARYITNYVSNYLQRYCDTYNAAVCMRDSVIAVHM